MFDLRTEALRALPQVRGLIVVADEGVQTLCQVPENCIPLDVVEVCGYITPGGERMFATRFTRGAPLSTVIGLLRIGEHHILRESESWDG